MRLASARTHIPIDRPYIILVGGAPLNEEFATAVGADAYCRDAADASEMAKQLVTAKRQRTAEPPGPSVN